MTIIVDFATTRLARPQGQFIQPPKRAASWRIAIQLILSPTYAVNLA
jgi:hypothetical protein